MTKLEESLINQNTNFKLCEIYLTMDFKYKYKKAADIEKNVTPSDQDTVVEIKKSPWNNLWGKLKILLPYLWPKKSVQLQLSVVTSVFLLMSLRVVNVFVPRLNKEIIDILALQNGQFPYGIILLYTLVKLLQGGTGSGRSGGLIGTLKSILWIKVEQNTSKELKLELFNHLHRLGVRWHNSRKTGEVLRIIDRGSSSVNTVLNAAFFQVLPIIIDTFVAMAALSYDLNFYFGLIILLTMIVYLVIAVIGTECRTNIKRSMNEADNEQRAKTVDSLLNSETVKMYGNEEYESDQFSQYMDVFLRKEWILRMLMNCFNTIQTLSLNCGLLVGSLYCAYLISLHELTVGDYVLFVTYMMQLMAPLKQLAFLYRTIQEALINMENMFEFMSVEEEIKNISEAKDFRSEDMNITFENVSFHYNVNQPVLKNISFKVPQGTTLAVVGPSGSGKSTLLKLLMRFFDTTEGKIKIGEENIKVFKQSSLRQNIGVVPQDTVLFNESIEYNIQYSKIGASIEESENAAKLAGIHEKILDFPDKYKTIVGERGLKLSGGEKQRIAIARTLLRSPNLMILDEATSSLDTATEKNIQNALAEVCKNRTCVVVAHRLSTIQEADNIIVLRDGEIVEQGSHDKLLALGKEYYSMWNIQKVPQ